MALPLEDTKKKSNKYKRTGKFLEIPESNPVHPQPPPPPLRRRSNSFPSLPLIPPPLTVHTPRRQWSHIDMSQRSAVARIKLEKLTPTPPPPESPHKASGKRSHNRFNLFSSSAPSTSNTPSSHHGGYHLLHPARALSVSSLQQLPSVSASRVLVPNTLCSSSRSNEKKLVVVSSSVPEDLRKTKCAYAILLAENVKLRAALDAEKMFSAKLSRFLQGYHESKGRLNPDPGNLRSAYYHGLEDENGRSLLTPEMLGEPVEPLVDVEEDYWSDEVEVSEKVAKKKVMIARSFESQRA